MRFIVTCEESERPSNSAIKQALKEIGLNNCSIVWVNNEGVITK